MRSGAKIRIGTAMTSDDCRGYVKTSRGSDRFVQQRQRTEKQRCERCSSGNEGWCFGQIRGGEWWQYVEKFCTGEVKEGEVKELSSIEVHRHGIERICRVMFRKGKVS